MLVLKKTHNAVVYERIVGIEKSHPHHSTTHFDAACACASLLTVPVCVLVFPYLCSEKQAYFCSFKYLTSARITPLLKSLLLPPCAAFALVSYSALLACMFSLSIWIYCIYMEFWLLKIVINLS